VHFLLRCDKNMNMLVCSAYPASQQRKAGAICLLAARLAQTARIRGQIIEMPV
jgi:hypothetical protein